MSDRTIRPMPPAARSTPPVHPTAPARRACRSARLGASALALVLAAPAAMEAAGATPVFEVTVTDGTPAPSAASPAADPVVAVPPEGLDTRPTDAIGPNERTIERVRREPAPAASRITDAAFRPSDPIDVRASFDGRAPLPRLNVDTVRQASTAPRGEPLGFRGYWNYPSHVSYAEIRVHRRGEARTATPLVTVPLDANGEGQWVVPTGAPTDLSYRLRVYDAAGRFDETEPTALTLADGPLSPPPGGVLRDDGLEAYGSDRTALRNIPVRGGLVTVTGDRVAPGEDVLVNGRPVPVDAEGRFVAEIVVPHGVSTVSVELTGPRARTIERDVEVPKTDVFYVALGEVTIGRNIRSGDVLRRANGEDPSSVDLTGRGAVYLKGRVRGDVLITAQADTGEAGDVDGLLHGLHDRSAVGLLQRLDPDRYYPVYGDDSDLVDGAPGRGLFVRVERDDTFLQYGAYSVAFEEAELTRLDRGVHGAVFQHRSLAQTAHGERRREITAFASSAETVPALESFLGTGGTIYRLGRQDVVLGTERLVVEVRDRTTGLVRSALPLEPGRDYQIDPVAGRVRLVKPLSARVADGSTVREGPRPGDEIYLVARYEYHAGPADLDGVDAGGRAQAWLGEHLRLGATAGSEATVGERRTRVGADVVLRHSPGTYLKAEVSRSEGPGILAATSADGGLSFGAGRLPPSEEALAWRVEGAVDLGSVLKGRIEGEAGAYVEHFERGHVGTRLAVAEDTLRYGAHLGAALTERVGVAARVDGVETGEGALRGRRVTASADLDVAFTPAVTGSVGVRHDRTDGVVAVGAPALTGPVAGTVLGATRLTGSRTDVAAEISYAAEDWGVNAFGQVTAQRSGERRRNDRVGVGGNLRLNDRVTVGADASYGTGGVGADVELAYQGDDDTTVTVGYGYTDDLSAAEARFDRAYDHALTARTTRRFSDYVSVYSEGQLGFTNLREGRDLAHSYGVELTPSEAWVVSGLFEAGELFNAEEGSFDRLGGSGTVAYRGERLRASTTLEARRDEGLGRDAEVYAARAALSYAPSDAWTIHGTAELVEASGAQTAVLDSDYTKLVAAAAYRPVEHDRINALAKYVYLSDLPPAGQIANGESFLPGQTSHIASLDVTADVAPWLTLTGKAALRTGEVTLAPVPLALGATGVAAGAVPGGVVRASVDTIRQMAALGVIRADLHVGENWDVMLEGRVLDVSKVDTLLGGVVGVWRRVGKVKVGAGYSFSSFSDDVADLTHDEHGWFVNVAAAL